MQKVIKLQRAMVINRRFSYNTLERHTGLSRSFIRRKVAEYQADGFIDRAGLGSIHEKLWRLTLEGKRQFDPNAPKDRVVNSFSGNRNAQVVKDRPEFRLWRAIRELKRFEFSELDELNLAGTTIARQYVSLLRRAGILSGIRASTEDRPNAYNMIYTVTDKAGDAAPVMGRIFYIFDPNRNEYWAQPMDDFEELKRPGDVDAS